LVRLSNTKNYGDLLLSITNVDEMKKIKGINENKATMAKEISLIDKKSIDNKKTIDEIEFTPEENISFRIALISIMVAIGIGGSYALVALPNIEILSLIIFITGYLYGWKVGTVVGAVSEAIFAGFNPMGVAPLVTYGTLIAAFTLIGFIGGLLGRNNKELKINSWNMYKFAIIGGILTLIFDLTTALSWIVVVPGVSIYLTLIMQVPFTIIHVVSNIFLFGLVGIPVISRVKMFENR